MAFPIDAENNVAFFFYSLEQWQDYIDSFHPRRKVLNITTKEKEVAIQYIM